MRHTRSFEHTPESVPEARHFARELARGSAADVVDAIELMVSELVTNCIRHTDSGFDLTIALSTEQIRVEVTDRGLGEPGMRSPRPSDPTGRGLRIVEMLSTHWGHEKRPGGAKTVWFTLTLEAESSTAGAAGRGLRDARPRSRRGRSVFGRGTDPPTPTTTVDHSRQRAVTARSNIAGKNPPQNRQVPHACSRAARPAQWRPWVRPELRPVRGLRPRARLRRRTLAPS
jgi:serine/threonine-protein kinase RsbW